MTRVQTALWFAQSFGLEIESMPLKQVESGQTHTTTMASDANRGTNISGFDSLSKEEKEKYRPNVISIRQILCWRLILS